MTHHHSLPDTAYLHYHSSRPTYSVFVIMVSTAVVTGGVGAFGPAVGGQAGHCCCVCITTRNCSAATTLTIPGLLSSICTMHRCGRVGCYYLIHTRAVELGAHGQVCLPLVALSVVDENLSQNSRISSLKLPFFEFVREGDRGMYVESCFTAINKGYFS